MRPVNVGCVAPSVLKLILIAHCVNKKYRSPARARLADWPVVGRKRNETTASCGVFAVLRRGQ